MGTPFQVTVDGPNESVLTAIKAINSPPVVVPPANENVLEDTPAPGPAENPTEVVTVGAATS